MGASRWSLWTISPKGKLVYAEGGLQKFAPKTSTMVHGSTAQDASSWISSSSQNEKMLLATKSDTTLPFLNMLTSSMSTWKTKMYLNLFQNPYDKEKTQDGLSVQISRYHTYRLQRCRYTKKYLSRYGKITPRYYTGVSLKFQKMLQLLWKKLVSWLSFHLLSVNNCFCW